MANRDSGKIDNIVGVHPPLGLLYIGAALQKHAIHTELFDANYNRNTYEALLAHPHKFDIMGISVLNQGHNFSVNLAQNLQGNIL